jgi:hypothetical protein
MEPGTWDADLEQSEQNTISPDSSETEIYDRLILFTLPPSSSNPELGQPLAWAAELRWTGELQAGETPDWPGNRGPWAAVGIGVIGFASVLGRGHRTRCPPPDPGPFISTARGTPSATT